MPLSLAEAAQATGLNKSTILRAIKSGRITGTRGPSGQWEIEAAEVHRVYPPAMAAAGRAGAFPRGAAGHAAASLAEAHQRAILAEQRLADAKAALDELRAQRDAWQAQAERLALAAPAARRSWRRRLGGGSGK